MGDGTDGTDSNPTDTDYLHLFPLRCAELEREHECLRTDSLFLSPKRMSIYLDMLSFVIGKN